MWAIFLPPAIFPACAPLLNFLFSFHFRQSRGADFNEIAFFRFSHRFPVCLFFASPTLIFFLGPFRPPARTHRRATQPKRKFENFKLEINTLRIFSVHGETKRAAFDSGPFHGTQNFLEASQDGSSPSLFVREAIL